MRYIIAFCLVLVSFLEFISPGVSFAAGVQPGQGIPVIQKVPQISLDSSNGYAQGGTNCSGYQVQWQTATQRAMGQLCTQQERFNSTTNYGNNDRTQVNQWWQNVYVQNAGPCGWTACPQPQPIYHCAHGYHNCGRSAKYFNPRHR
ncbi:MAG: hypothetical protein ACYCT9_04645 [Leptospirillum sp.]